jgi:hypothetical protein
MTQTDSKGRTIVTTPTTPRQKMVWTVAEQCTIMRITAIVHLGRGTWGVHHLAQSTMGETYFELTPEGIRDCWWQEVAPARHTSIDDWSTYKGD